MTLKILLKNIPVLQTFLKVYSQQTEKADVNYSKDNVPIKFKQTLQNIR